MLSSVLPSLLAIEAIGIVPLAIVLKELISAWDHILPLFFGVFVIQDAVVLK
jgi:hypothetical protein